jgi:hypothetical protein
MKTAPRGAFFLDEKRIPKDPSRQDAACHSGRQLKPQSSQAVSPPGQSLLEATQALWAGHQIGRSSGQSKYCPPQQLIWLSSRPAACRSVQRLTSPPHS